MERGGERKEREDTAEKGRERKSKERENRGKEGKKEREWKKIKRENVNSHFWL